MTKSIFAEVAEQLFNNEKYNNERVLKFMNYYPQNAIVHMTTVMKAFKCKGIKKEYNYNTGRFNYLLEYTDLNTLSDLVATKFECYENEQYKKKLKGYFDNKSEVNDKYRVELECPNWSSQKDEYGYAQCPFNNREYEQLDPQDNVVLNFKLQGLGYKDYEDFANQHRELTKEQLQTVLSEELDTLEEMSIARHWEV